MSDQNKDYSWLSRIIGNLRHNIVTECVPILIRGGEHTEAARLSDRFEQEAEAAIQSHIDKHYFTPKELSDELAERDGYWRSEVEQAVARFASDIQRKVHLEYQAGGRYPGHLIEPWADVVRPIINREAAKLSTNNKLTLADVASPNPSPEAQRAIQGAVDRSMEIQRNIGKDTLERSE